jgi:hypothetical protein
MNNPWIQTRSAKAFDLLDPQSDQIDLADICFALSNINRFTGHAGRVSVAAHSIAVGDMLPPEHRLWGYLHDASEAYLGDVSSPLKALLPRYSMIENRIQRAIYMKFLGVPKPCAQVADLVKQADVAVMFYERDRFLGLSSRQWGIPPPQITCVCYPSSYADEPVMSPLLYSRIEGLLK